MEEKREMSIDLIKIFACFGVVSLHTIKGGLGLPNLLIYILATVSMPLFFTINGYLLFRHKEISWKYIGRRVGKILGVCFMWEILHAVAYFLFYHEMRNFLKSFILDFFQQGLFYHFWFMGALILVYFFAHFLRSLAKYNLKSYVWLTIFMGGICVSVDIFSMITKNDISANVNQTLRIWLWLFFFMLGGAVRLRRNEIIEYVRTHRLKSKILAVSLFTLIIWRVFLANCIYGTYAGNSIYGSFPVILAVAGILLFAISTEPIFLLSEIKIVSPLIMGIYIFHPFILSIIVHFIPVVLENLWTNILYWISVIVISGIVTFGVSKIPVIKELIRI